MHRPPRFVIATPICDGHDVAAAAITRILRAQGTEAVYLGFNKSAYQIAKAASEEDATGIAVSTYNGGHMSFLREVLAEQARQGIPHVPLFAGGGGTILEREVAPLLRMGVAKVYRPPLDLAEAVRDMTTLANDAARECPAPSVNGAASFRALAQRLTAIEWDGVQPAESNASDRPVVWGIGGRGGAGKSTLIDELLLRFLRSTDGRVAVLTADPTLGDRLRMVHCYSPHAFVRSVSVGPGDSTEAKTAPLVAELRAHGFDLILVESVGLGQNELGVAPVADASVFCMTPEYGSDVQLEKEALLRRADLVVMNKRDFPQAEARYARVRRFVGDNDRVFLTEAKRFGDTGVTALFEEIARRSGLFAPSPSRGEGWGEDETSPGKPGTSKQTRTVGWCESPSPVPFSRRGYLGTVVDEHEAYYAEAEGEAALASNGGASRDYQTEYDRIWQTYGFDGDLSGAIVEDGVAYRETPNGRVPIARETTTGLWTPVLGLPDRDASPRQIVRYLYTQNLPGAFPFTEGAYRFRRRDEDPIRMFAGLGMPETTNARFHLLAAGHGAPRLSTAFDSLTLYGLDSDEPGALAKVGEGGVAVDTLDDMLRLYDGFDLSRTSVSMTINGPAPTLMAMFLVAARRRGFDWKSLRGTVQADILKEVQAQNEALFPLEPSLRLIADMTEYMMREAPGWYPLSISGYHIGEAGANPVQELAFTLANGLTYIETLRARGLPIEEFTRRFSFFFTSGSELEFNVLGRVARRVWAVALKRCYGVEGPGLALRFHSQTSGRSLQDSEPLHNLTRVTLQAEHALHNNTNSLHTNSYKETYTTPQEDDVLLAMGSQQIPLVESGDFGYIENLNQGAYGLTYLEAEVERAVHRIFREIDQQGGVLPAIENEYFRTAIQEEVQRERGAMRDGKRRVVGVNYLASRDGARPRGELVHIPMKSKRAQAARTRAFKREHATGADAALERLQAAAVSDANVFEALLDAVEYATVGQITHALWEVWGRFRPSM
ncbi:MAG: methylmalonyl-CoA mutase family protein [Chloroflexi bacterium]|nr:methylmalonyl-CoA mutase family protein [Chloroflexota bacterium]